MLSSALKQLGDHFDLLAIVEHPELLKYPDSVRDKLKILDFSEACPDFSTFSENLAPELINKASTSYRFDVKRFAHKIFAIDSAYNQTENQILVWVDSDVTFLRNIEELTLRRWLPDEAHLSFLGRYHLGARSNVRYPECGFMMFRRSFWTSDFINSFKKLYTLGGFAYHKEWHDSYLFMDLIDQTKAVERKKAFNISELGLIPLSDQTHVFIASELGAFMDHFKGSRKSLGESPELKERRSFLISLGVS